VSARRLAAALRNIGVMKLTPPGLGPVVDLVSGGEVEWPPIAN